MAESKKDAPSTGEGSKQPFVATEDRPAVKIDLDTPLSQLRVRELSAILGFMTGKNPFEVGKTSLKDFFDKDFPEVAKDYLKDVKSDKFENLKAEKNEKLEQKETKPEKFEKHEKLETIEKTKSEKVENDAVVFDPAVRADPRIEQVIQAVTGLTKQVAQLANQVEELRKKVSG